MLRRKIVNKLFKYSGTLKILRTLSGNEKLRIVMYHRVFDKGDDFSYFLDGVPPYEFEKQMCFLSKNFSVMDMEEAVDRIESGKALPERTVSITIDDGYRDCYDNIYSILRKNGLPATIYLTTGNIGSSNAFWADKVAYILKNGKRSDDFYHHNLLDIIEVESPEKRVIALKQTVQKLKFMTEINKNIIINDLRDFFHIKEDELQADYNLTWDEVREMSKNGISIGAHTVTHPILTKVDVKTAEFEIVESKKKIEREIGKKIYGFCYPNGESLDFNECIINMLKKHGFKYAITTAWGFNDRKSDLFRLKRIGPNCDDDMDRFERIVSGGFEVANKLRKIIKAKK